MNPDQTPAAHLPAPLPYPAALLHRTQAALGLLREVVQESSAEYWYERGKAAMGREDWSNAFHYLKKCLDLSPKHWQSSLRLAVTELNAFGNFIADNVASAVIDAYNNAWVNRQIIQQELLSTEWNLIFNNLELEIKYSNFESPIFALAVLYWINDSENELRLTLDIISKRTISLKSFGIWHRLSGTHWLNIHSSGESRIEARRHALQSFKYALEVDDSNPIVWLLSADTKLHLADNQGAVVDYTQTIKILPNSKNAFIGRGQAKSNLHLYKEAILDLDQAIIIEPNNAYTYYLRAEIKLTSEDIEGCIADCSKAIEFKYPHYNLAASHNALKTRAAAKKKIGDTLGARRDWHDAISLARQWEGANNEY